jgi:CRP-like cAMP-binding protein
VGSDVTSTPPLSACLGRLALFADLPAETVEELASAVHDERYGEGDWILRQGDANCGLRVIIEGEAGVVIDGIDRAVLHAGMVFGEISALLDEPVTASVVARAPLRCALIDRSDLIPFLLANPTVALRLLQAEARRLADTIRWHA